MYGFSTPRQGAEYYRLFNEGFERRIIFSSQEDYDRFEAYLYLLNSVESPRVSNIFAGNRTEEIFTTARGERLVAIGAYSFLAREFHILATPLVEGGISKFMQKVQTAYTMYFNKKYVRSGSLFQTAYKSEPVAGDERVTYSFADIHLQPAMLFNEEWRDASDYELHSLAAKALQYRYSGAGEYVSRTFAIIDPGAFPKLLLRSRTPDFYVRHWKKGKDMARER
ncbi:MAG TPA: hypothetical protein VNM40_00015 [Candidatus Paceibacterota bacterium]|nr:hypothetical protein [Candidatus Paceibacterota bacterium]